MGISWPDISHILGAFFDPSAGMSGSRAGTVEIGSSEVIFSPVSHVCFDKEPLIVLLMRANFKDADAFPVRVLEFLAKLFVADFFGVDPTFETSAITKMQVLCARFLFCTIHAETGTGSHFRTKFSANSRIRMVDCINYQRPPQTNRVSIRNC